MARFRTVETYPQTGFPDRMWGGHPQQPGDPATDAFLRAARPVVALYTEALEQVHVDGPRSSLWISVTAGLDPTDVRLTLWKQEPDDGPERAFVTLPSSIQEMDAAGRAALALEVVHAGVRALAGVRGWDPDAFDGCHEHVVKHDFVYSWAGPWKTSPDRRHQARATYRMADPDGFGRVCLELRRRGEQQTLAVTPPALSGCTTKGLRSSAATLRWSDAADVALIPLMGHGPKVQGMLMASIEHTGEVVFDVRDDVTTRTPEVETPMGVDVPVPTVVVSLG
ncbi:hypothetical protein [Nocardioides sp.]|uniref:hypothetical protein n=1 Tax=Nocardioides sp. TaxID=35761 RepID=UPI002C353965|nr:hypothetical protein [Nocardioides sp.]HXH81240.1 hypothetical protein [Nocardioides sp.]